MRLSEIQLEAKKPKQVKASDKKPKLIKPNKGNESPHPMRGKLVGEANNKEPNDKGVDLVLPRGKIQVLKAEDKDYDRGVLIKLLEDGGYDMAYWYDKFKTYPVEVLVDGKSIKKDAKKVTMKFHPELEEANNKKPELPKQNNPVAKHSRNMPGAGSHKSPKDYDRKKQKQDLKKQLDESPYVVSKVEAVGTAVDRTKEWLQSLWTKSGDAQLEAIKELGVLVGFTAEKRSENNIIFNKFFTQTENKKR